MRTVLRLLALVIAAAAQPSFAQSPASAAQEYYPPEAKAAAQNGEAVLSCTIQRNGTLAACEVVSEAPAGMGFGDAALKLSAQFKMKPKTVNGKPVSGGRVRIPVKFKVPG